MAVAFRSSSATGTSDAYVQSAVIPVPAGVAANDIIIVKLEMWETAAATVTAPSGFTQFVDFTSGNSKLKMFWKRTTGADTGSYTFTWVGNQWTMGHAEAWSGCKTSGTPVTAGAVVTATSTSIPTHSVTVAFSNPGLSSAVANENLANVTTPPTGFTEREDGDYLHTMTMVGSGTGTFNAASGVVAASTLIIAVLVALEPAGGSGLTGAAGTAVESDSALSVGKTKRKAGGVAAETSTAQPVGRQKSKTLDAPSETDTAVALVRSKRKALGLATSTEVALPLGKFKLRTLGVPVEFDAAQPLGKAKLRTLGVSTSVDTAVAVTATPTIRVTLSPAATTDTALPLVVAKQKRVHPAVEVSTAAELSTPALAWRLVPPTIRERWPVRGRVRVGLSRECTVFGDGDTLFLAEHGRLPGGGGDSWGAIPEDTPFVWLGGHLNTTTDPAVRALWLAHAHLGLSVETVNVP